MKKRLLSILAGVSSIGLAFIRAVLADGGFVVARGHINKTFIKLKDADLICPCSAGDDGKLYFWIGD